MVRIGGAIHESHIACLGRLPHGLPLGGKAQENKCVQITDLFKKELPSIGGLRWRMIQLNKNNESWYMLFEQTAEDGKDLKNGKWVLTDRHSQEMPDFYCIIGQGHSSELLASLHQNTSDERYGMPGSGYPRCGGGDVMDGLKVRMWANRELGESAVLALEKSTPQNFMLIWSNDDHWILLNTKSKNGTCYFDRGSGSKMRQFTINSN